MEKESRVQVLLMLLRYGETKQSTGGTNVDIAWRKKEYRQYYY